jgi:hypothetical protein
MSERHRRRSPEHSSSRFSGPPSPDCGWRSESGGLAVDPLGQTGNFAGSGFLVQDPFFDRFVDDGLGRVEPFDGFFCVPGRGLAYILDDVFYPGLNGPITQAPPLVLAGALQC